MDNVNARLLACLCVLAIVATLGCKSESPMNQGDDGEPAFVLHAGNLTDSFLLGENERVRWRFTEEAFVVESYQQPLPNHLVDLLLLEKGVTYRISGHWELFDNGHTLLLTELQADEANAKHEVRLSLNPARREEVIINSHAYRFSESLPLREILPERIYTAAIDEVISGDVLRVRSGGEVHEVKLAGITCLETDDPIGRVARQRSQEFVANSQLSVKVFGQDNQGRDVVHIWAGLRFLNMSLLTEGLARHDKHNDNEWIFATAEDEARVNKRGLWDYATSIGHSPLDERVDGGDHNHHGSDRELPHSTGESS